MKIKEKCVYRVKVGDVIAFTDGMTGKIVSVSKRPGQFMAGTHYSFLTDSIWMGTVTAFGIHWYNGRRYPAEKLPILG